MRSAIDLTGQKFGMLTVLQRVQNRKQPCGLQVARFLCECDCGNQKIVDAGALKSKHGTKSCGCNRGFPKNLANMKFGMLTAIQPSLPRISKGGHKMRMWKCQCECGNFSYVSVHDLISGNTQSCGCIKSRGQKKIIQYLRMNNIQYEYQKTFDGLNSKNGYPLSFDFAICINNDYFLLEYQGQQHYLQSCFGQKQRKQTDKIKKEWCVRNNICLQQIRYDEDIPQSLQNIINHHKTIPCQAS